MRFVSLILLLASWLAHSAEPELLEPEKAFRLSARLASGTAIEVRYQIAVGYYMYRDKFRFAIEPGTGTLEQPQLPAGKMKRDEFFGDQPMDDLNKSLFTFASYNAGPGRIRQLRRETERRGLNPNVWFGNVERIASERIGRETVTYVSNIYKYYVAYKLILEENNRRNAAKSAIKGST